jgi:hypothetical protein
MAHDSSIPAFTSICRNCGAELGGTFCSRCGQEHRHERLSVGYWLHDALGAVASLDSRIWRTVAALTIRPGRMVADYVAGRHAPFVSPLRYAIATCALWLFLAVMANDATGGATVPWWVQYGQIINLASLPFMAATYQLPFLKSGYNYAETLSFTLYTGGHLFLWRAGLAVAAAFGAPNNVLLLIDNVLFFAYTSWALWQFHAGRAGWRPLRIFGALLGASIFGAALNVALSIFSPPA